jgi:hypothetical protein
MKWLCYEFGLCHVPLFIGCKRGCHTFSITDATQDTSHTRCNIVYIGISVFIFFGLNKENIKECRAFGRLARKKRMNYYIPKSYQCSSIYIQYMFGQLWWFKWLWTTLVFSLLALTFRNERNKEPIDYWAPTTWQVGGKQ